MTSLKESNAYQSWGRTLRAKHYVFKALNRDQAWEALRLAAEQGSTLLGFGLGRSYGDSNLNPDGILYVSQGLDRFISFDRTTGIIRAEAGVSLSDILSIVVPHGFFLPTTPGSCFVTLGGAVANDVHGKNHHHAGSFGNSVTKIGLVRSDRGELELSPDTEPELFAATIGGLGLTGLINWVEFQLVPVSSSFLDEQSMIFKNCDEFFDVEADHRDQFEHTVSWIDCTARGKNLGRGFFTGGNWATDGRFQSSPPSGPTLGFDLPGFALNRFSLKAFNTLYFARQKLKSRRRESHYSSFFYPLDAIQGWNRLYGRNGFFQYQSVIPMESAREATKEMLARVARSGQGSMLAVLKTFGSRPSRGLISFPREGATLALDFKNAGARTHNLLSTLDEIVLAAGGRLYPAKDGRISADMFQSGYPNWMQLENLRDPVISSAFWRRVTRNT